MPAICTKCQVKKTLKDFGPDYKSSTGKSSWCKPCKKEYQKQYVRTRRAEPEYRKKHNESARHTRLRWYGLTDADFDEISDIQGGVCAGCSYAPKPGKNLNIDHKHQKGDKKREPWERIAYVRGLLCHTCNRALGLVRDNPETLRRLAKFVEAPPAQTVTMPKLRRILELAGVIDIKSPELLHLLDQEDAGPPPEKK